MLVFLCLILFTAAESELSSSSSSELSKAFSLFDTGGGSSESLETKRELKEYYAWLFKEQQKDLVDKYRQEISNEEKDQLKYFEGILKKVKEYGQSGRKSMILIV